VNRRLRSIAALATVAVLASGCVRPTIQRAARGEVFEGRAIAASAYASYGAGVIAEASGDLGEAERRFRKKEKKRLRALQQEQQQHHQEQQHQQKQHQQASETQQCLAVHVKHTDHLLIKGLAKFELERKTHSQKAIQKHLIR
jgi:Sec-independent protein translocase protein TatA